MRRMKGPKKAKRKNSPNFEQKDQEFLRKRRRNFWKRQNRKAHGIRRSWIIKIYIVISNLTGKY